jgi:phenylacetate-CoA ligase
VFPAGVGQTEMQVQAIADLKPACYIGTPSFLKIISRRPTRWVRHLQPEEGGRERRGLPATGAQAARRPRHRRLQSYGTADLGLVAYETEAREGLVVDEA